ncbi:MAG: tetratricopeptide repeat protein [Bryobacteraceae bacterium]
MIENTKLLLLLFRRPAAAMSLILDRGSLLFSIASVVILSWLLRPRFPFSFYTPLLVLAVVYVPGALLLSKLLARTRGTAGTVFHRDYAPLFTCTAMAWSAANLPLVAEAWLFPTIGALGLALLTGVVYLYFLVLMFFAVRTVFGMENGAAAAVVCLSWIPLLAAAFLWGPLRFILGWLASPFVLFYLYYYLRSEAGNLGAGLRSGQNFRRTLDAAAVNPHDGEAQYQLGLIYQQRRQVTEAIQRFEAALAIDPSETDAHFQLGRIALQQGRLKDALAQFQIVLDQDEKHHQSEILRELGALYNTARQFEDARQELARYVERRPYDPEGLYYYGQSLEGLGRFAEAREIYARSSEAADTAPAYLRRSAAKWSRLAQKQIRKLSAAG